MRITFGVPRICCFSIYFQLFLRLCERQREHLSLMSIRTEYERFPFIAVGKKIEKANSIIPRNTQWNLYIIILLVFDVLTTMLAFWLAYYIRFLNPRGIFDEGGVVSFEQYGICLLYTSPS